MAARATQARGDGDGDEGEDDGGLLGGGLRAMREHPAAFAASAALGVGVNYLSFLVIEARGAAPPRGIVVRVSHRRTRNESPKRVTQTSHGGREPSRDSSSRSRLVTSPLVP